MKQILSLLLIVASSAFADNCKDWINNSDNCLYDTTYQRPTFGNTEEYMEEGKSACITYNDKYYTYEDSVILKNGLMVKFLLPRKLCRIIESITTIKIPKSVRVPRYKIDRECCERQACVGCSQKYIRRELDKCYHGEADLICKQTYYADSTYYKWAYQVKYSDSVKVDFEYSSTKTRVELNPDYFVDGNSIEIYRTDGTLRYRGELTYVPGDLENLPTYKTRGWCYNKAGNMEARKTNNVGLCK